jgi:hypothetical protein
VQYYHTKFERRADSNHRLMEISFSIYSVLGYGVTKSGVGYYEFVGAYCLRLHGRSERRSGAHQDPFLELVGGNDPEVMYVLCLILRVVV